MVAPWSCGSAFGLLVEVWGIRDESPWLVYSSEWLVYESVQDRGVGFLRKKAWGGTIRL